MTKLGEEGLRGPSPGLPISPAVRSRRVAPLEYSPLGAESADEPDPRDWLAAIISGSDDAIISKDLNGIIRTWNAGATRLFGCSAEEAVGKPITILIPEDRLDEEPTILAAIKRGDRVDHFETVRRRKDGSFVDLSLTISPVRNARGAVVGASKIARDITERRVAQEKQRLLYGEMQHRVKNLFALAAGIVSLSARSGADIRTVTENARSRLAALSRAHELTMPDWQGDGLIGQTTTLRTLVRAILQPYAGHQKIDVSGDDPEVGPRALPHVALLLHELATNAAKYGCLSEIEGSLAVRVVEENGTVELKWTEHSPTQVLPPSSHGFGSHLEKSVQMSLAATIQREWQSSGLTVRIAIPVDQLTN